tara:strand:- start:1549 stop:2340 length:792 start_codon:yes stop_codon:yes gene_type:complete
MSNIDQRLRAIFSSAERLNELRAIAPSDINPRRLLSAYCAEIRNDRKLQAQTLDLHAGALLQCARIGLVPGAQRHVYLIPQRGTIDVVPSYKGLIVQLKRSGDVVSVEARCVYDCDHFVVHAGTERKIEHIPDLKLQAPDSMIAVYAVATFADGTFQFEYMRKSDIDEVKKASRGADSGASPWSKWYPQMAKKTAIKRLIQVIGIDSADLAASLYADDRSDGYVEKPQEAAVAVVDEDGVVEEHPLANAHRHSENKPMVNFED